jgi:hypothetical protein
LASHEENRYVRGTKGSTNNTKIQGDFESCAGISTSGDIFREKGAKSFSKKPYTNVDIFREKVFLKKFGSR